MGTTPNYSLRYPDPTSNVELWTHIQNLADDVDDTIDEVSGVRICKLRQAAVQSIPDSADTKITFGTAAGNEDSDIGGWHSLTVNNTRITPTNTGWYSVGIIMNWEFTTALQYVDTFIYKNGAVVERLGNQQQPASGQNNVSKSGGCLTVPLTVDTLGDYFEMGARQTSGGARNTNGGGGNAAPRFWVKYEGPL
jgi:hypothetical protein